MTFVFLFSGGFQTLFPRGFKDPCESKKLSWIRGYFQKQTCFVSRFLEVDVFCFFMLLRPASIGIRVLTYPSLVVDI